ncbi:hypothetical protein HMN09_01328900 [Mycena chlorophos]|uniref:Uncharacterized protein n=1 Tax=Mycena chlorophos TaxID=658473 RepID=A0A8H6RZ80_MYCCL|nr:hypothetical protein HMN09_01328900 [Mycena chlorophos]
MMSASTKSASKLYRSLSSPEDGTAVFLPAPNENLPDVCKRTGVQVGDVGIRRGKNMSLELLFNALLPADEAVNQNWGVPEGFVPFTNGAGVNVKGDKGFHTTGTIIAGRKGRKTSFTLGGNSTLSVPIPLSADSSAELSLRSKSAAALFLPNGASREDLIPIKQFRQYIHQHAAAWYAFAEALGFLPSLNRDDALFVVTGCDKASAWVIMTASRKRRSVGCNLNLSLPNAVSANFAPKYEWERSAYELVRVSEPTDSDVKNQCVFVRGCVVSKPRRATSLWAAMVKKMVKRREGRDNEYGEVCGPSAGMAI